jgi:hypothetical protein
MTKPNCKLVGTDGNVFAIIGTVSRTLKRAGQPYDDVLALCWEYVEVF